VLDMDDVGRAHYAGQKLVIARMSKLARVSASVKKDPVNGGSAVAWGRSAAAPRLTTLEDGSVVVHEGGVADSANSAAPNDGIDSAAGATRAPAFTASEHARILHVLIDDRMTSARRLLSRPRDRDELDRELINTWDDHICPLFNDRSFAPACNELLCDGITASDVAGIEPLRVEHERTSSQIADKWGETAFGIYEVPRQVPEIWSTRRRCLS
jgi:hypothetical protein